jgi:hypothetical protein
VCVWQDAFFNSFTHGVFTLFILLPTLVLLLLDNFSGHELGVELSGGLEGLLNVRIADYGLVCSLV